MNSHTTESVSAVISYVEAHLDDRLDLDTVARAACYSKYHLHRMFTNAAGMTLHSYVRRRRLTEAARRLAFSQKTILEIALAAGYESQRAFSSVFQAMYKKTPLEYRKSGAFYPLQLEFIPQENAAVTDGVRRSIAYAAPADLPDWMEFLPLVIDGFPCLDETLHRKRVQRYMERQQALLMREGSVTIGAAAFSLQTGSIDFLAVHPRYRRGGAAQALLDFLTRNVFAGREISITTFREGDRADTGQRAAYRRLGFIESELLTEFGYPTQRLVLPPNQEARRYG